MSLWGPKLSHNASDPQVWCELVRIMNILVAVRVRNKYRYKIEQKSIQSPKMGRNTK